jgi:hypothetical protein
MISAALGEVRGLGHFEKAKHLRLESLPQKRFLRIKVEVLRFRVIAKGAVQ